jgi:hypothetical protein
MFERCVWLNEPRNWGLEGGFLSVATNQGTDFWRECPATITIAGLATTMIAGEGAREGQSAGGA